MTQEKGMYKGREIMSASDIAGTEVPEIDYYIDGLLRPGGRLALVAAKKMGKSLMAMDLGLHLAEGKEYLGFTTRPCNVLYVNFEIAEEKLMERLQDLQIINGFESSRFKAITLHEGFALDHGPEELADLLDHCEAELEFPVEVLILDPRMKLIARDENQYSVLAAFCGSLDYLMGHYAGLAVIIVHHEGKGTTGSGRGHSVFDGWVDTTMIVKPTYKDSGPTLGHDRLLIVEGRDTEEMLLGLEFEYPKYKLSPDALMRSMSKVGRAKADIMAILQGAGTLPQGELRSICRNRKHSDYAFNKAVRELVRDGDLIQEHTGGAGNAKAVRLPDEEDPTPD